MENIGMVLICRCGERAGQVLDKSVLQDIKCAARLRMEVRRNDNMPDLSAYFAATAALHLSLQ
jgi:hypothetical protein